MTAFITLGAALLIFAAWFALAIGVALIVGAVIAGPMRRWDDEPDTDLGEPTYREDDPWAAYLQELADRKARVEKVRRYGRAA